MYKKERKKERKKENNGYGAYFYKLGSMPMVSDESITLLF